MAALKTITTHRLVVLLVVFLLGNSYLLLPTDPDSAGSTDLYLPVGLLSGSLVLTTLAAATILLYVRMALSSAEAKAAAACKQGVDYKVYLSPGWRKLRALLLLAIGLSLASTFLAIVTFEFGTRYRKGRTSVLFGWPAWVVGTNLVIGVKSIVLGHVLFVCMALVVVVDFSSSYLYVRQHGVAAGLAAQRWSECTRANRQARR